MQECEEEAVVGWEAQLPALLDSYDFLFSETMQPASAALPIYATNTRSLQFLESSGFICAPGSFSVLTKPVEKLLVEMRERLDVIIVY